MLALGLGFVSQVDEPDRRHRPTFDAGRKVSRVYDFLATLFQLSSDGVADPRRIGTPARLARITATSRA